jgi:uncharacterized membrane protein
MLEFIWKYLVGPVVAEAEGGTAVWNGVQAVAGYNIYNTIAWALIGITAILGLLKLFEKYDIELDADLALNYLPLILLAGVLRFVQDATNMNIIVEVLLITPVIYVWIAGLALLLLYLSRKEFFDWRIVNSLFLLAASGLVVSLGVPLIPVVLVFAGSGILAGLYYFVTDGTRYQSLPLTFAVLSQLFEAFSSMYGLTQGYEPRQIITSTVVDIFGPDGFLGVKLGILVVSLSLFFDLEDKWRAVLLLVLYSIGLATGVRVLLRAALGV